MARAVRVIVMSPVPSIGPPPPGVPPTSFVADPVAGASTIAFPVVFTGAEEVTIGRADINVINLAISDTVSPGLFKQAVWDALQPLAAQLGYAIDRQQVMLMVIPSVGI